MKLDKKNGKAVEMVKCRSWKVWRFSSNEFWKNISSLVSASTFVNGGYRRRDNPEGKNISGNKSKRNSNRVKVYLYEVCLSYIIYCLFSIL